MKSKAYFTVFYFITVDVTANAKTIPTSLVTTIATDRLIIDDSTYVLFY